MYVRKRKTIGTPVNERSGGKDSYRNSSRDGAASVSQRDSLSRHNVPERRNVSHNSDSRSNWSSQRSQENRHSEAQSVPPFKSLLQNSSSARRDEVQRPPPFKSLIQSNPIARRDSFPVPDRRNNDYQIDRDYHAKKEDLFNNRSSYGMQHDRWESYNQRESANRGLYSESERGFEKPSIRDTMEKLFGSEFRHGSAPFSSTSAERFGGGGQRGGISISHMNQGDISYSDRRDDSYYSDRRDDPYYSDKRGYASSDRRRDPSPERRAHSSYSERRGDSFPEGGHGSYPGRRNDDSLDRGSVGGYYRDRRDSDPHPAKRYDFHSDRRVDDSYSERGYASHRDRREDDTYNDRKVSDYYLEKRGGGSYPDDRGSSYADGRGASSYMDYERSNNLSFNDQHRGANIPFDNRGRADDSYHVKQQRRVDASYVSRQKQGLNSYMDKPRGHSYPSMDVSLEENISYGSEKRRSKASERGRRTDEKPRGSNYGDVLESPSNDEKQAAMGILKKVLAQQQSSRPRRRIPSAKPDHGGKHNVEIRGDSGNRNAHLSKKVGIKGNFKKGYQNRNVEGNIRKTLPQKRPLDAVSSPQSKKPRISVLSRLGPKLEKTNDEVFTRLGPRSGNVKSRLGPRSVSGRLAGQTAMVTGDPAGQKLSAKDIKQLEKKHKNLPVEVLSCSKCKQDKFLSVNEYLLHQIEEHHDKIDASFHKKLGSLIKYLQCNAQLAYAHDGAIFTSKKKAVWCEICDFSVNITRPHSEVHECKVIHEFSTPLKCCKFGRYQGRSFYENHINTLPHFVKKSKILIKNQERYKYEEEKLELMKKAYLNGSSSVTDEDGSILKVKFLHEVLGREGRIYRQFGTVPVPEEVSSLLQAYKDLTEPLPAGNVLTQIKKLESKYYDPSNIHGKYKIVFETNFKCDVCGILLERSQQSIIDHCSTREHYDNVVKERQKLREKVNKQKDVTKTENAANKRESSGIKDDYSEEDFNDVDVFGDHHKKKREKRVRKDSVSDKKDEKAVVKKEDREENKEAKEVEMDETKEGEPTEEMDVELVNENNKQDDDNDGIGNKRDDADIKENAKQKDADVNKIDKQEDDNVNENEKQEDDDVDIYSDPYGGGELLEGVEEKQEVVCDDEESGDDANEQEQEEEVDEDDANEQEQEEKDDANEQEQEEEEDEDDANEQEQEEEEDEDNANEQEQEEEDDANEQEQEEDDDANEQEQEEEDDEDDANEHEQEEEDDANEEEQEDDDDANEEEQEEDDDANEEEQEEEDDEDEANEQEQEDEDNEDDETQNDCSDDADADAC